MSCHHLTGNAGPAPFWRRVLCSDCRKARRADALVAFALLCRKSEPAPANGLKQTLAALDLPCSMPRPRRQRFGLLMRRIRRPAAIVAGGVLALGFAWTRYIDIDPKITVPYPAMHRPNAYDSFNRAASLYRDDATASKMLDQLKKRKEQAGKAETPASTSQSPPGAPMMSGGMMGAMPAPLAQAAPQTAEEKEHEYSADEREELLRASKPALDALREGLDREYLAPPVRSSETLLPYLAEYRKLARLLRFESEVRAERGEYGKAAQSSLDAIALGIKIEHSSPVIGKLVGMACEAIGRASLWDIIPRLSAAEARAATVRLEQLTAAKPTTSDTFTEEKWVTISSTLEIMRKPGWRGNAASLLGTDNTAANWEFYLTSLPYSKTRILGALEQHMNRLIVESAKPYTGPTREEVPEDRPAPKLLEILLPEFSQFRFRDLVDDAENRLLVTALALHAYHVERGSYPASLTSLSPAYVKGVPLDPFTANLPFATNLPLRYRRAGQAYVLWSVGPDVVDQGGTAIQNPLSQDSTRSAVQIDSNGDIVAGVNRN